MKRVLLALLLMTNIGIAFAESGVLVAITAYDGRKSSEYYGLISQGKYDAITAGLTEYAMVKVDDVFWINSEGKKERMSTTHRNGHRFGYTNTIFVREDYITRIVILDQKYLDKLIEE
ncbi:MAG: hypothetical protein KBT87_12915 [Gammaproteobacteria bacterium]|nr:hypothetical protein [Gammaproteobacteria bacterium]MBQ0775570.1 hypothetical protein [Gammaproteobacteria bacterium]